MGFGYRISSAWWPALGLLSPLIAPWMVNRWLRFRSGQREAEERNARRLEGARPLELPTLQSMEITVIVEQKHEEGFLGDPAVSYLIGTDRGSLLIDEDLVMGYRLQTRISEIYFNRYNETMKKLQSIVMNIPLEVD